MQFNPINKSKTSSFIIKLHNDLIDVEFYVYKTKLPNIKLERAEVTAPSITYYEPGTHLTFGELPLTILCDEGLDIRDKIFDYITQNTSRGDMIYTDIEYPKFDAILYILSNKGTPIKKYIFEASWIDEIGDYELKPEDDEINTFDINVMYTLCRREDIS
jgi:hypothetical protein